MNDLLPAPEFLDCKYCTKSNVYSFGVVGMTSTIYESVLLTHRLFLKPSQDYLLTLRRERTTGYGKHLSKCKVSLINIYYYISGSCEKQNQNRHSFSSADKAGTCLEELATLIKDFAIDCTSRSAKGDHQFYL